MGRIILPLLAIFAMLLSACVTRQKSTQSVTQTEEEKEETTMTNLTITSLEIRQGQIIPKRYTCDGENISPPLTIEGIPEKTQSLALSVEDPDAPSGTWIHWLLWNIPPQFNKIPEGSVPPSAIQGTNDFGDESWGGPCPPPGREHRYMFKLYALDALLELKKGAKKPLLEKAMEGHILAQTELVGIYIRGR